MKKRLRKKKRLGEFQEFGFEARFTLNPDLSVEKRNAVLEDFIDCGIEANGLLFGGGSGGNTWEGFVTLDRPRGSTTEEHREVVRIWLEQNTEISDVSVGEFRDAWHGWGV